LGIFIYQLRSVVSHGELRDFLELKSKLKKSFDDLGVARRDKNNLVALFSKFVESLEAKMKR
jgi:hypothetical protein